jgi:hypothetical protein
MGFESMLPAPRLIPLKLLAPLLFAFPVLSQADDGLRGVDVRRFGISVRVPQAWNLIDWAANEKAFVLRVPQDAGSMSGLVACELGVAPASLEELQKRHQANDEAEQKQDTPRRKLLENRIEKLDPDRYGADKAQHIGQRLVSLWQQSDERGASFDLRVRLISHDTLYTFVLASDEAHFDAYRADFEEMLQRATFTPPETGLQRLPGGFWLQRDFRFALQLPSDWQPSFAPHDKVLFFATGASHEAFTDNVLVLASPARPLELAELKESYPAAIKAEDPNAAVDCKLVPQGEGIALETVIHTQRGAYALTILERRFQGQRRNYEVKFTCETGEFQRIEAELRKSLHSFRELKDPAAKTIL